MEKWQTIKDFENYEVSTKGRVRNKKTGRILKETIKTKRSRYGYCYVFLYKNSKRVTKMVHRLVGLAFIPNPDHLPQINHKDENSTNNDVVNLEWCTCKYNANYGTVIERKRQYMKEHSVWKGKHHSKESIEKMRQKKLGVPSKRRIPVIINGVQYKSITDAMHQLGLCTRAIYRMLKRGE